MKRLIRGLLPLALFSACGCTYLFFKPSRALFSDPAAAGYNCEAVKFSAADGAQLTGLYFPPAGPPKAIVVHFHGNGQNMTAHYHYSAWLAAHGYGVLVFDYRGYGASGGKPSLDGALLDGEAALREALKLPGAEPDKVVIFGQSLGAAIAVAAVGESGFKPAAMVLEGGFDSYRGVAAAVLRRDVLGWPISWLPWMVVSGRHSPAAYIGRIDCPKLFISSPRDPVVPFQQGKELYEAAKPPKEFWRPSSGHIEAFGSFRALYGPRLLAFLQTALR